ncbi:3'(2'),5'-bisphosphate nucleotidase CysQ [Stappia sp. F7233]|uniref:3'(2'),5'-bisphosphate nucleotidase CysQ n=1 Tax=Stappia albiluteola TaxID=2758565 RepID=A0A839AHZ8_9HYPH|nr:3'(2'),5'-bisphosphate nucleotidase CysQ [Stappia albiluteola]
MEDAQSDLDLLEAAAREAGRVALGFFGCDPRRWSKEGDSPVSEADIAVDRALHELLTSARPEYGWLSEETTDDAARLSRRRIFVVDPIDGTRAFLSGGDEWTVALAVVEEGRPISAAVYRPVGDEMYLARTGSGTMMNGARVRVSRRDSLEGATFAGPKAVAGRSDLKARGLEYAGYIPSLAYRLALVAAGRIDIAAARGRACDWDLAAADLLVQEAGGRLTDLSGRTAHYNKTDVRHGALIAGPANLVEDLRPMLDLAM